MEVVVLPPEINGDTVVFRWVSSEPNPFQRIDGFSFRYEGIDLSRSTDDLFYEIFLALQLNVFAAFARPVTLHFPIPVCASSVAFWTAFHNADLVTIEPAGGPPTYSPWRMAAPARATPARHAVFFGGGKDSLLTAALLGEIKGQDRVLLIQYVGPLRPQPALAIRLEQRQERLMLRPAREELGFATQRVWTDYQANFRPGADRVRPHFELYTAGALPALLAGGANACSFGTPRTAYPILRGKDGKPRFRYASSRPETLATQSKHYQRVLGTEMTVTCFHALFTTLMAQGLLAQRYPAASRHATSCTLGGVDERWCYGCKKCSEYALYGLHFGHVDDRFDYDRMYRSSRYIERIVEYAVSGAGLGPHGNAPWTSAWCSAHHYAVAGHTLATLDVRPLAGRLGQDATVNLLTFAALFGNTAFPESEQLARSTIDFVGTDLARQVGAIAEGYFDVIDDLAGPSPYGNTEVAYDFRREMPTRTGQLDHIRS